MARYRNRKGQDLVEYGALLVIFVMFAILAINAIRSSTGEIYSNVQTGVQDARNRSDAAANDRLPPAPAAPAAPAAPGAPAAAPAAPAAPAAVEAPAAPAPAAGSEAAPK
ncbi:MAG: hypothetical protein HY814_02645 [Candidatus Riflebacteria bacterium]|nr:hypothetical protein [Candidatus Riflebacteria bacterium]